jgi:hypothetical protein
LNPKSVEEVPMSLEEALVNYMGERREQSLFLAGEEVS